MAAVRHLGFSKIWLLSTGTPRTADFPSPYQIWRKNVDRRLNYGPKSKSKMAAVRHLGFVTSSYRTTHKSLFIGPHRPVKFYANPMYSFEDMTIWYVCRFGLKYLFTTPKFWFLGAKIGEGIFGFRPQPNQFFRFRPQRFLPNFVKIGWKMRP